MHEHGSKVVVGMLGARMHYAVPRILHQFGLLERFYTDTYIGNKPALEHLLNKAAAWSGGGEVSRLLGRSDSEISAELVTSFDGLGIRYALARRRAKGEAGRAAVYERYAYLFNRALVKKGFGGAKAAWGFNTASGEMFRAARADGLKCMLEQTILPAKLEAKLLAEVAEECGDWQPDFQPGTGSLHHLECREWELADLIVAGSPFVAEGLKACGVEESKIAVVPYGIDSRLFNPPAAVGSKKGRPLRLLFAGEVGLRKGVPYLLQALDRLPRGSVTAKFAGNVTLERERLAPYSEFAEFLGPLPRSRLPDLFKWADLFVLPSVVEGSATVTYEALLSGVPVLTTPNSGSIIEDGISGRIVPVRDSNALKEALLSYAEDEELLARHTEGALRAREKASLSTYADNLHQVVSVALS